MTDAHHRILIVAGGTGGHIYPALAVAEHLKNFDVTAVWLGSRSGLESRIVPAAGLRLFRLAVTGLRRRGLTGWLMAPFTLTIALLQAIWVVVRTKPRIVLGMGGFASGPGGLAAWICRRPLVIHEQNAVAGLTNSLLSRIATRVLQGFPGAFPKDRVSATIGNPVRESIVALQPPAARARSDDRVRLLVVGGSRGAGALNAHVPLALARLGHASVEVWHQAGAGGTAKTQQCYQGNGLSARVSEFIDDMSVAYAWADIVVCRAGAITVSELAAVGVASILVPYPFAVDDHQTKNAQYLLGADAALVVAEGEDFTQRLATALQQLTADRASLLDYACRARSLAKPNATADVARVCLELIDA